MPLFPGRLPARVLAAAVLLAAAPAFLPPPARAQSLFPDLIPDGAVLVVTLPRASAAWEAMQRSPLRNALRAVAAPAAAGGEAADPGVLLGRALDAVEISLTGRDADGAPGFLALGRVRDPALLRQTLDAFEQEAARRAGRPENPVTRTAEGIGDSALVLLTDARSTLAWFVNGPGGICGLSNDASVLRTAARRLAAGGAAAPVAPAAARAALEQHAPWTATAHLRFFIPPARTPEARPSVGGGELPAALLRSFQPAGAQIGAVQFDPDCLRLATLARFAPAGDPLLSQLYRAAPASAVLPGAELSTTHALFLGGGTLLEIPLMKRILRRGLDQWSADLPPANPAGLTPATARTRSRLALVRGWLDDPAFLTELGPAWFCALNAVDFETPGVFPRIDLVVGFQTTREAETRRRLLAAEKDLLAALDGDAPGTDPPLPDSTLRPDGVTELASPAAPDGGAGRGRAGFRTATLPVAQAAPAVIRYLEQPGLPATIRPAWIVRDGWLLIALTPQSLADGFARAADAAPRLAFEGLRERVGADRFQTGQILRFRQAVPVLAAVAQALAAPSNPASGPRIARVFRALAPVDTLVLLRRGTAEGVFTDGLITLRAAPPADAP